MLQPPHRVQLLPHWAGEPADAMIALHARRSAPSIAAWRQARPAAPLVVVLTGTDLYRDIDDSADAQRSLQLADRLVVLQPLGVQRLPAALRGKAVAIVQSSPALAPWPKPQRHLRALMAGHLRAEKDPATYFAAARLLHDRRDIRLDHLGAALDPALAAGAQATMAACPRYRWLGMQTHAQTRRRLRAAHLLVHPSVMEGGAQVVIEAVTAGTPVLASRIDGNLGLLGDGYDGCFAPGDAAALAALLRRCRDEPAMLAHLQRQCAARAPLFTPERERAALLALMETFG